MVKLVVFFTRLGISVIVATNGKIYFKLQQNKDSLTNDLPFMTYLSFPYFFIIYSSYNSYTYKYDHLNTWI